MDISGRTERCTTANEWIKTCCSLAHSSKSVNKINQLKTTIAVTPSLVKILCRNKLPGSGNSVKHCVIEIGGNGFISLRQWELRFRSGNQNSIGGANTYSFGLAGKLCDQRLFQLYLILINDCSHVSLSNS